MRILRRYYLKEFIKLFLLISLGVSALLAMLGLIKKLDVFMRHEPPAMDIVKYGLLIMPQYFLSLMPMAALMCSLFIVGAAVRNRETVAVTAAGGRVKDVMGPIVIAGAVLSVVALAVGEFVVPACETAGRDIRNRIEKKKPIPSYLYNGKLWLRTEDGAIVKADFFIEEEGRMAGVSVFKIASGGLREIAHAESAAYARERDTWRLSKVRIYDSATGKFTRRDEMDYRIMAGPEELTRRVGRPGEMGMLELRRYLKRMQDAGFKNQRLEVEWQGKLSNPLVSLFMVLLGVSFAVRRTMGGLMATGIGLMLSLLYWLGQSFGMSMGYAGVLPAVAAAWIMPVIFGTASVYLFKSMPE